MWGVLQRFPGAIVISFFQMPFECWASDDYVPWSWPQEGAPTKDQPALCAVKWAHVLAIENAGYMSYSIHPCLPYEMQQKWNENWQYSVFTKVNYQKITKQTTFAQRILTKTCVSSTLQKVEFIFLQKNPVLPVDLVGQNPDSTTYSA